MAKTYKFVMHCWQDQYGSENAKANIFVNNAQVATEVEITATSADSLQRVTFETIGLPDPNDDLSVTADIKVVLTNEAYVDANNDRNIWISGLFSFTKEEGWNTPSHNGYFFLPEAKYNANQRTWDNYVALTDSAINDDSAIWNKRKTIASNVQGSQIETDWWEDNHNDKWIYIPVWGDESSVGTTITLPLIVQYNIYYRKRALRLFFYDQNLAEDVGVEPTLTGLEPVVLP